MEIIKENFYNHIKEIEESISNCSFISFDTELTGLETSKYKKWSILDNVEERYQKGKNSAENFLISQFGLSTWNYDQDLQKWICKTFNIYLFPAPFEWIDVRFTCQSSSLLFLTQHQFDFNKFIYHGVPYLSLKQLPKLELGLQDKINLLKTPENDKIMNIYPAERIFIDNICEKVKIWKESNEQKYLVENCNFYLQKNLRQKLNSIYDDLYYESKNDSEMLIFKSTIQEKEKRIQEEIDLLKQNFEKTIGFSRIIEYIIKYCQNKPIVGHNLYLDLLQTFSKFYSNLPDNLTEFKNQLHKIFPMIYDTKYIAKFSPEIKNLFVSTSLGDIYKYYCENNSKCEKSIIIEHAQNFERYKDNHDHAHEAGFDAWMTGFIFIYMISNITNLSGQDMFNSIKLLDYRNKLNLLNSNTFLNITGPQNEPDFSHFFYLYDLPKNTTNLDIIEIFKDFTITGVKWFGDSCVLIFDDSIDTNLILQMKKKLNFKMIPYIDYLQWKKKVAFRKPSISNYYWYGIGLFSGIITSFFFNFVWKSKK